MRKSSKGFRSRWCGSYILNASRESLRGCGKIGKRVGKKRRHDSPHYITPVSCRGTGGIYEFQPVREGERFNVGSLDFHVLATPGHTDVKCSSVAVLAVHNGTSVGDPAACRACAIIPDAAISFSP